MLTEKTFQGSAVSINYAEGPCGGQPMLLLHGVTQRWQAFLSLFPQLTQTHHVFALDFRGHGKSGHAAHAYRGEDFAQDVLAFIHEVIAKPAVIYGHSLGGMVGVYVAGLCPERVRALIIGDSKLFLRNLNGSMYGQMFEKTLALLRQRLTFEDLSAAVSEMVLDSPIYGKVPMKALPGCDESYLAAWCRSLLQLDPDVLQMLNDGSSAANWRPEEFLRKVTCPTLLMQGDPGMGGLMTDEGVARARELLVQSQHVCLTGLGHSPAVVRSRPGS